MRSILGQNGQFLNCRNEQRGGLVTCTPKKIVSNRHTAEKVEQFKNKIKKLKSSHCFKNKKAIPQRMIHRIQNNHVENK